MKLKFKGSVKNNIFIPDQIEAYQLNINKFEGKEVWVTLGGVKKTRSLNQNRYYHGVILKMISDETGYTPEEVHEVIKARFLPIPITLGGVGIIPGSTTDLSTDEFELLMGKVRKWGDTELNLYIPEPNEVPFEF